ncbi:cytochrome P450 [Rhodococcus sp. 14-2470-1a]|uniref:cytochrome P450 n=1 Tax=Rhodococcus sp. 14-2470-1a TaxID=2023150 RepID=UPI000B9C6AAD|nr:cytochrome P450 [Rhodococcus sp. 14-2470-1a]OZF45757.1 cytochrome P450 [Rhodococcus sp. 14-2470-1a]
MTETSDTATRDLPPYPTPRDGKCPFLPSPEIRQLHADGTALSKARIWDDSTPWLVTTHAAQRTIMSDPRVSANDHLPGFPIATRSMAETISDRPKTIFDTDGAEHAGLRRLLTNAFTRGRMEKVRPGIQQATDDLIDKMLAGPNPTDLVEAIALPLPSLMICELLGVPYEDHEFFEVHAKIANARDTEPEESTKSTRALGGYVTQLIQDRMDDPQENVVSDLAKKVKAGDIDLPGASMLGMILLIAGHETSANMISLGTAALLQNPEQLAIVRDTTDKKVIAGAVEELLRYLTIPHLLQRRIATEDIEYEGTTIKAGDGIISPLPAANFDPVAFPEPEKLDLTREARHHHAFGWGPHQCIGQQLARIELEVVYSTLFKRIPTLALATDFDNLHFKGDSLAYGIYELPVTW